MKCAMKSTVSSICSKLLLSATLAAGFTATATADSEPTKAVRPVTATWNLEAGSGHLADTYLSPLRYSGVAAAVGYERWQAMRFSPKRWAMRLRVRLDMAHTTLPRSGTPMWSLGLEGDWSMMWRFSPMERLTLYGGPLIQARLGCLYLSRNGNNPVQAQAHAAVGVAAAATYALSLGRLPVTLGVQPSLPLAGVFFMPQYGELYYEIGLGNRTGLVHAAWPGSWRSVECLVSADLHLGHTTLRLGYRFDLTSARANHITSRSLRHMAVVGVGGKWMSVAPGSTLTERARIISAYY